MEKYWLRQKCLRGLLSHAQPGEASGNAFSPGPKLQKPGDKENEPVQEQGGSGVVLHSAHWLCHKPAWCCRKHSFTVSPGNQPKKRLFE